MVSRTVMIGIVAAIVVIIAGAGIYALMQPPVTPPVTKHKMAVLLPGSITDAGWNSAMYVGATALGLEMNATLDVTIAEGLGQGCSTNNEGLRQQRIRHNCSLDNTVHR